jgi:hypothetical protein
MSVAIASINNTFEYQNSLNVKECSDVYNKIIEFYVQSIVTEKKSDTIVITIDPIEENCAICFGQFDQQEIDILVKCEHVFHKKCMKSWINKNIREPSYTCPLCRTSYDKPPEMVLSERTVSLPQPDIMDSHDRVRQMIIVRLSTFVLVISAIVLLTILTSK